MNSWMNKQEKTTIRNKVTNALFAYAFAALLFPTVLFSQGWGFTADLAYSGYCPGATGISLPQISGFPTKADCESVRSQILAISISSGSCTVYYKCSPCTGSDINNDQYNPGTLNLNSQFEGKPMFTAHNSKAFEDWATGYRKQLEAYGIKSILGNTLTAKEFPQTGNSKFDAAYGKNASGFKAKSKSTDRPNTSKEKVEKEDYYGTVSLLTSKEEQAKRDEWYDKKGFNNKPGNNVRAINSSEGIKDLTGESESNSLELISSGYSKFEDKLPLNPLQKFIRSSEETFIGNTFEVLTDETSNFFKYMTGESSREPEGNLDIKIVNKTTEDIAYKNIVGDTKDKIQEKATTGVYEYVKTAAIGFMGQRYGAKGAADTKNLIKTGEELKEVFGID